MGRSTGARGAVAFALLAIALSGCGGKESGPAPSPLGPASSPADSGASVIPVEVSLSEGGSPMKGVSLMVGETLEIRLETNPSTGYEWKVTKEPSPDVLKFAGKAQEASASPLPGSTGEQIFRYVTKGKGTTEIRLEYARPFGNGKVEQKAIVRAQVT